MSRVMAGRARARSGAGKPQNSLWFDLILWAQFVYLVGPWDLFQHRSEAEITNGNAVSRTIKLVLLGIAFAMVVWRWAAAARTLRQINRFLLVFLILAPLSVLWSIDRGATIAREVTLMSLVLVCFAFALGPWQPHRYQQVMRPILTTLLLASLVFGLLYPELAIEQGEGTLKNAWHGLTSQKNQLGQMASFCVLLWFHAFISKQSSRLLAVAGAALSGVMLLLSRSSTSLLATVFACMLMLMMLQLPTAMRRYVPYLVGVFATVVIVYAIAMLKLVPGLDVVLSPVMSITGKDLTFSNRSVIWEIIEEHIQYAPVLGSGYGAYWTGPVPTSASYEFLSRMYFYPSESHNGYLEITNDLGFVGLVVLLGYLAAYVRQCLRLIRIDRMQAGLFLSLFFQQLIINLTESSWLSTSAAMTATVMISATLMIGRSLQESPQAPRQEPRRFVRGAARRARRLGPTSP